MAETSAPQRTHLSAGLSDLWQMRGPEPMFDVVIVGSGYGGSVAASKLANASNADGEPLSVCVLERGKEYLPGEFPSTFGELPGHLRLAHQNSGHVSGKHEGLFDVRLGDDVVALVANGLGGGSLINAGVLLAPNPEDFPASNPMRSLVGNLKKGGYFEQALCELGGLVKRNGQHIPNTMARHLAHPLKKTQALESLAGVLPFELPPISVAMDAEPNSAGVKLNPCTLCGDCMTGCNVGAKDSLDTNLLEKAARAKVKMFTGASVLSLKREVSAHAPPHWVVRIAHTAPRRQEREAYPLFVRARKVILAAGTLGSTEILLRSRDEKLVFSSRLGEKFSCNGDNIAAVHRLPSNTNSMADEDQPLDQRQVGPTITGSIPVKGKGKGFLVQEFAVPGALKQVLEEIVTTAHVLHQMPKADLSRHGHENENQTDPLAVNDEDMRRSLVVGVIGHDDAAGTLHLPRPLRPTNRPPQAGTLRIRWPEARHASLLNESHDALSALVRKVPASPRASLIANPMWRMLPKDLADLVTQPVGPVLTVHPLGGCGIGNSHLDGVVDEFGRVFDGNSNPVADLETIDAWHGSLIVLDGSIMPGSLGVNPALTITATAMRAMDTLLADWRFKPTALPVPLSMPATLRRKLAPSDPALPVHHPATPTSIEIVERLSGPVTLHLGESLPRKCIVELTLAYAPVNVKSLLPTLRRPLQVESRQLQSQSRLRIYDEDEWMAQRLRVESDLTRSRFTLFDADLEGSLQFLHREPSTPLQRRLRSAWAWVRNRGLRDSWQTLFDKPAAQRQSIGDYIESLCKLASRAGEVRRFDYALKIAHIHQALFDAQDNERALIHAGDLILGSKRLTYNRRANPWRQLMEMSLHSMPAMHETKTPILKLDTRFMANQGFPLLRITQQQDHAKALLDLFSFGMLIARILVSTHLWTFRKPDTPGTTEPVRLPGTVPGLAPPEITELVVDRRGRDGALSTAHHQVDAENLVKIRLTRYRPNDPHQNPDVVRPPLVMIHGYSVSGNTFTHEAIDTSAVSFFCGQGREVWVVDLRTSTGLASASEPWAMEQPALIDIPAALLHIRNATQQKVDVLAHCIGCVMLSMALLTDARKVRTGGTQLGVNTWLTSEHLGILMAFNGSNPDSSGHPCINRIVLSQKGPVLRYTDSNVFRAFVLQSTRRWLLADSFQFRAPRQGKVSDELLDRFLASVPYPDADYDVENPLLPWKRTPWTSTRHRMDALYGRDFNASNINEATLAAIDDLFGPINLDTVAQTIHFARFHSITNQSGRGEFVTRKRLRECWGSIPTLAIHGRENGLVDVTTQDLLQTHLQGAGVPFRAISSDSSPYDHLGHQDVMIGTSSARVFQDIEDFLTEGFMAPATQTPAVEPPTAQQTVVVAVPWLGPRLDLPDAIDQPLQIACMSHPAHGTSTLVLVPGQVTGTLAQQNLAYQVINAPHCVVTGGHGDSGAWLFAKPELPDLSALDTPSGQLGYFAFLVYEVDETATVNPPNRTQSKPKPSPDNGEGQEPDRQIALPGNDGAVIGIGNDEWLNQPLVLILPLGLDFLAANGHPTPNPFLTNLGAWVARQPAKLMSLGFIPLGAMQKASDLHKLASPSQDFSLALASCQYPSGLLDGPVAGASLSALGTAIGRATNPVDLVLMVGDQIYADATAGLMDPVRRDELYDQPHDKALRLDPMRAVLRNAPVRMLIDDHELCDNWEPLPKVVQHHRPEDAKANADEREHGLAAWHKYQRLQNPGNPASSVHKAATADYDFKFAGYPFFFADTRLGRSPRGSSVVLQHQDILTRRQWARLTYWLQGNKDEVKFVATPSLLLPRRRTTQADQHGHDDSDAWDGFPQSLDKLLGFIAEQQIRNTVFLSGDEHHGLVTEVCLHPASGKAPVKLVSIHSPGLYSPFVFANGHPNDLVGQETIHRPTLDIEVKATFAPPGNGFATVRPIVTAAGGHGLTVHFAKGDGHAPHQIDVTL